MTRRIPALLLALLAAAAALPSQERRPQWAGRYVGELPVTNGPRQFELFLGPGPGAGTILGSLRAHAAGATFEGTIVDGRVHLRGDFNDGKVVEVAGRFAGDRFVPAAGGSPALPSVRRAGPLPAGILAPQVVVPTDLERPHTVDRGGLPAALVRPVDELMARVAQEQGIVGMSLVIGWDGALRHVLSVGFSDYSARTPASAVTRYRWASISKPVTAVLALQLAAAAALDLDEDIHNYVPEFPAKKHPVTSRQILCHQSGLPHYRGTRWTPREYDVTFPFGDRIRALDLFGASPLIAAPGTRFHYSTHAYVLLGAVVQRAAKKPFRELLAERVFEPLGMTTTGRDHPGEPVPHRTRGYHPMRDGRIVQSVTEPVLWKVPGGGLISTVEDLGRFGLGLLGDQLLDEEQRREMFTAQRTADGKGTAYGLGIGVRTVNAHRIVTHSGSQNETATLLWVDLDRGLVVAAMSNTLGSRLGTLVAGVHRLVATHLDR